MPLPLHPHSHAKTDFVFLLNNLFCQDIVKDVSRHTMLHFWKIVEKRQILGYVFKRVKSNSRGKDKQSDFESLFYYGF